MPAIEAFRNSMTFLVRVPVLSEKMYWTCKQTQHAGSLSSVHNEHTPLLVYDGVLGYTVHATKIFPCVHVQSVLAYLAEFFVQVGCPCSSCGVRGFIVHLHILHTQTRIKCGLRGQSRGWEDKEWNHTYQRCQDRQETKILPNWWTEPG